MDKATLYLHHLPLLADEIATHRSTCATYCLRSLITAGLIFGSKTIGATFATDCAHSNNTEAPGSITVARVPM